MLQNSRYTLLVFCVICGAFGGYFVSIYVLIVVLVVCAYIHSTSFKLLGDELKASSRACGNTIIRWIQTVTQSLMNSYQLSRPLTPEPNSRRATPFSGNGSLSRRPSFRGGRYVCTDENADYVNRRNGYTVFRSSPVCNNRFSSNSREFKSPGSFSDGDSLKLEEFSCSTPNSPWERSGNEYNNLRRIPTAAGPLLASSPARRNTSDYGLLIDAQSPGLVGRIVQYSEENSSPSNNRPWTHQPQYSSLGQLPIVHLNRSAHSTPVLSLSKQKAARKSVRVRIAPPDPVSSRLYPLSNRTNITQSVVTLSDQSTKSVLETLKEISRKRIHSQMDDSDDDSAKRQKKNGCNDQPATRQINETPTENDSQLKRSREDSAGQETSPSNRPVKRVCNNEILSSLSSSRILLQMGGTKRKTRNLDWSRSSTPVEKQKKIGDDNSHSEAEGAVETPVARPSQQGGVHKKNIRLMAASEDDIKSPKRPAPSKTPASSKTPDTSKTPVSSKTPSPSQSSTSKTNESAKMNKISSPESDTTQKASGHDSLKAAVEDSIPITVDLKHKQFCEDVPWKTDSPFVKVYSPDDVLDDPLALEEERQEDRAKRLDAMLTVLNGGAPWQKENVEGDEGADDKEEEERRLQHLKYFKKGQEPEYLRTKKEKPKASVNSQPSSAVSASGGVTLTRSISATSPAMPTLVSQAITTQSTAISTPISFGSSPWSMKPSESMSKSPAATTSGTISTPTATDTTSVATAIAPGGSGDAPAVPVAPAPASAPSFVFGNMVTSSSFSSPLSSLTATSTPAPALPTFSLPSSSAVTTSTVSQATPTAPVSTSAATATPSFAHTSSSGLAVAASSPFTFGTGTSPATSSTNLLKLPTEKSMLTSKPTTPSTNSTQIFGSTSTSGFGGFGSLPVTTSAPAAAAATTTTTATTSAAVAAAAAAASAIVASPITSVTTTTSASPAFGFTQNISFGTGNSSSSSSLFGSSQNTVIPASSSAVPTTATTAVPTTTSAAPLFSFGSSASSTVGSKASVPFNFGSSAVSTVPSASAASTASTLTFGSSSTIPAIAAPISTQANALPFTFGGTNSLVPSATPGAPTTTSSSIFVSPNNAPGGFTFPRKQGESPYSRETLIVPPCTNPSAQGFKFDFEARRKALSQAAASSNSNVFGSGTAPVTTNSLFGGGTVTSTANPFGSGAASTGNTFGSGTTPAANAFGTGTATAAGNLFGTGTAATASTTTTTAGNVFGSNTATVAAGSAFTFGSGTSAAPNGGVFGGAVGGSAPKPFTFGASQPAGQPKPFGSIASPPQNPSNLFAQPTAQTTQQKPNLFSFGSNTSSPANSGFSIQPVTTTSAPAPSGFSMQPISTASNVFSPQPASTNANGFSNPTPGAFSLPTTTASSGFNFQAANTFTPATTASSVFGFGAATTSAPTPGVFSFGASQQPTQPSSSGLFTFGSNASKPAETSAFGQPAAPAVQPAPNPFQFGASAPAPQVPGTFQFGGQSSLPSNSQFSGPAFNPGAFTSGPAMFSIGSGSTAPRARSSRNRRPK